MRIPRLIAFDLDGTLTESKQRISAEMADLLMKLLSKMPVAVMSGAGFPQFERQFLSVLPSEAVLERLSIFPDNAAQCFVRHGGKWMPQYDYSFSAAERERILAAFSHAAQSYPAPERLWGPQIEDRGAEIAFSALGQDAPLEEKERWHASHEHDRDTLREALSLLLPEFEVTEGGLTTVQVTRKNRNKAYGLARLSEITHIPLGEMLYVGDALEEGGNDAVVVQTDIPTHAVFGPRETAALIEEILAVAR